VSQTKAQLLDGSVVSVSFGAGSAAAPSINYSADSTTGIYFPGSGQLAISTGGSGRLIINSTGQISIPHTVTSLTTTIAINNTDSTSGTGNRIALQSNGTNVAAFDWDYTGGVFNTNISSYGGIIFKTSGASPTEKLRITSGGLVGIGVTNPSKLLHVQSGSVSGAARGGTFAKTLFESSDATATYWEFQAASTATNDFLFSKGNTGSYGIVGYDHVNDALRFYSNAQERMRLDSSGRLGLGVTGPQAQLHVLDSIKVSNSSQSQGSVILGDGSTTAFNVGIARWNGGTNAAGAGGIGYFSQGTGNVGGHYFYTGDAAAGSQTARLVVNPSGNVGIGTNNPQQDLHLNDASGVSRIRLTGGAIGATSFEIGQSIIGVSNSGFSIYDVDATASRFVIDSSGRVGIGTTAPGSPLEIQGSADATTLLTLACSSGTANGSITNVLRSTCNSNNFWANFRYDGTAHIWNVNAVEAMRIDSSRRLLIGTSSARGLFFTGAAAAQTQIEGNSTATASLSITRNDATADGNALILAKARSTSYAIVQYVNGTTSDDRIGRISFQGADGTNLVPAATIECYVDATPGANDMPGRLVFSTTADGAASPTEAMRINNQRELLIGTITRTSNGGVLQVSNGITFPAAQSACTDPNTLDDYEEGTWTPALGGTWTTNPTFNAAKYTKIGRVVHITLSFTGGSKSSATSGWITGLPFGSDAPGGQGGNGNVSDTSITNVGICVFYDTRLFITALTFVNGSNYMNATYFV